MKGNERVLNEKRHRNFACVALTSQTCARWERNKKQQIKRTEGWASSLECYVECNMPWMIFKNFDARFVVVEMVM